MAEDFSRKAGEEGELEARKTGDEHARDHGKEKAASRILSPSLSPLRAHHFSQRERRLGTRQSFYDSFEDLQPILKTIHTKC